MFKRNTLIWAAVSFAALACLIIIGFTNSGLSSKANTQTVNDSIGGTVQFSYKQAVFGEPFDPSFDGSNFTVNNLSISFQDFYYIQGTMNGKEKDIAVVYLTLLNNSNSPVYINLGKSYIVNSQGQKAEASIINSSKIDGEIGPNQFKEGEIVFPLFSSAFLEEESGNYLTIPKLQLVMEGPADAKGSKLGSDIVFNFNTVSYKLGNAGNLGHITGQDILQVPAPAQAIITKPFNPNYKLEVKTLQKNFWPECNADLDELWIVYPDGTKEKIVSPDPNTGDDSKRIVNIFNMMISSDKTKIYYNTSAFSTGCTVHMVNLFTGVDTYIDQGVLNGIIESGNYKGDLEITQTSNDQNWITSRYVIVNDDGLKVGNWRDTSME